MMTNTKRTMIAIALMAGMCFLSSVYALQGTLLTSMIGHYGLTDSAQGFASAASFAGGVVALLTSFFLIGKIPKMTLLRIAFGICTAFLVLLKFAPAFAAFVGIWVLLGVGLGYVDMLLSSCMADLYEGRAATRMLCLLHMGYGVASMISPLIYNAMLKDGIAWNSVYIYVAGFGLLLLIYATIAVGRSGGNTGKLSAEKKLSFAEMIAIFKKGVLPGLTAAAFCHGVFLGGLNTWINRYVDVTLNSSIKGYALSCLFMGVMVSRLIMSVTSINTRKYVKLGGIAAAMVLVVALIIRNGVATTVLAAACGICFGALCPCIIDIACAETPESSMFATTVFMLSMYIGQSLVSPVIGALETAFNLHVGIALCAAAMIACSLCCGVALRKKSI